MHYGTFLTLSPFLSQFFYFIGQGIFCPPKSSTITIFHRRFLIAACKGPKADKIIFCSPEISSNFHRHFLWRHVQVLKLRCWWRWSCSVYRRRARPRACQLSSPQTGKRIHTLLLLGYRNFGPLLICKRSKACLLGFSKNLCPEPGQKLKTSYHIYQDKNTPITKKFPGNVYCVRSPSGL